MPETKGHSSTELTELKREKPELLEEKHRRLMHKFAIEDWPIDVYRPVRSQNWTRAPIKYNASQDELMFIDRTFCQFIGGGSALVSALYGLGSLAYYPWYIVLPYALCSWGLFVGCVWDLCNECFPVNRWFFAVRCYRGLNAAFASIFCINNLLFHVTSDYNYIAQSVSLEAWYFTNIMVATYCGFSTFFGHHRGMGTLLAQLLFPVTTQLIILISAKVNGIPEYESPIAFSGWILLLGFSILTFFGMLVAIRLALYHAMMCISLFMLTFGLQSYGKEFCENSRYGTTHPNIWFIFLGFVVGMGFVYFQQPLQIEATRRMLMNGFWNRLWSRLLLQPAWDPMQLDLRRNKNQPFLGMKAWWLGSRMDAVSGFRRANDLCIPRAEFVPASQLFYVDGSTVRFVFGQEGNDMDARLPHSDVRTGLYHKLRFSVGQDGAYWYPTKFAFSGPAPAPPPSLVQAKFQGTLLEFLVWYGHLSTMLRKITPDDKAIGDLEGATHVIDLEWMSGFEVKPEYHRCGGRAFFRQNPASMRMHCLFLTKPRDTKKLYPMRLISGETDWRYDQAEQILLMSSHALVTLGYHHCGIHAMMSLVGVALHNGFDTNDGDFFHPWRTAMNLHFYNHISVNDNVTGPLFEGQAVLAQIFPFTTRGLYDFLQVVANDYELCADADLEARKEVLDGHFPEMSTLFCETRFKELFSQYAQMIADVCWKNDDELVRDSQMQKFIKNLNANLPRGLPERLKANGSAKFTSKAQVVEFTASVMHIVTVRHEAYGTLFWNTAFEPAFMQSKLPLDFGPPSVADYEAMIGFAVTTSRKFATKLMVRPGAMPGEKTTVGLPKNAQGVGMKDFKYLLRSLPEEDDLGTRKAYDYLQGALNALYVEVAGTREKRDKANWFLNVTPEMLEVGASY